MYHDIITGFSKLNKDEKIKFISQFFKSPHQTEEEIRSYWYIDPHIQQRFDEFSENTISNFYMPYSLAPNFLINDQMYIVPMVIEESSVVAAASHAAKYWAERGGFHSEIIATEKLGQVHFYWEGNPQKLQELFPKFKVKCLQETTGITENMRKRGGGIKDISLRNMSEVERNYYQIWASFDTCDSMGANFINTCLETFAHCLIDFFETDADLRTEKKPQIIMSILSNYTPNCLVRTWVACPIEQLTGFGTLSAQEFAWRFERAVHIARIDPYRAATHNKGIFNGIDAVVLATGNDFRAVEAGGHTFACRDGHYRSLSQVSLSGGMFNFSLTLPLALGVVGGLTNLHPMVKCSLELLQNPSSETLMMIASAAGLANNFSAVRSLTTTGIQKGHMKMHLYNMLNHFTATEEQKNLAVEHFKDHVISYNAVRTFLEELQN
ncbi:MAG: hydroxymethylglutaryl-CoA reductase [Deltaproteobacteria bacterium]|nr:hydroxymethylglutaryl-CoA reductase [Deltaproteobacteria bacterium]